VTEFLGEDRAVSLPLISVVIPAFNEAPRIPPALAPLRGAEAVEVIVVDGESGDASVEVARECGARVLRAKRGRATQMNVGAREARGEVLLFLHVDSILPDGFSRDVHEVLDRPGVCAGAFRLEIDDARRSLRWIERAANWRSHRLQMPYGDQALFLRANVFHEVGGFPELPLMEDLELVRRLRRRGRIAIARSAVRTSARRWARVGPWRATLINQLAVAAYMSGVSVEKVARWYRTGRLWP
jgi:rSAM/selenodomain-associated transferase 2